MWISELADRVGVPTSTVRYYERIGLLGAPARTGSGYRAYDEESATRLLFVTRARRLGLSCDQITDLLPVWDGTNCAAAGERVGRLIDDKKAEIAARIAELVWSSPRSSTTRGPRWMPRRRWTPAGPTCPVVCRPAPPSSSRSS